jgi:hypothetical protein
VTRPDRVVWPEDLPDAIARMRVVERTFEHAITDPACDDIPLLTRVRLLRNARRLRRLFEKELARRDRLARRVRHAAQGAGILKFPERWVQ